MFQLRASPTSDGIEEVIVARPAPGWSRQDQSPSGRWTSWGGRGNTDHPVTIQVLVESGFQGFQGSAGSRHNAAGEVRGEVAVAVRTPHRVLAGAHFPCQIVAAACRLLRANRRS